jgi:hypothetical protein
LPTVLSAHPKLLCELSPTSYAGACHSLVGDLTAPLASLFTAVALLLRQTDNMSHGHCSDLVCQIVERSQSCG